MEEIAKLKSLLTQAHTALTESGVNTQLTDQIAQKIGLKTKQNILDRVSDLVADFLYYDRKEDEELSDEQLHNAFIDGTVTVDEVVECFRNDLINAVANQDE